MSPNSAARIAATKHKEETDGSDFVEGARAEAARRASRGRRCGDPRSGMVDRGGGGRIAEIQVQTAEGTLSGAWQPGFRLFQGIPYAEPPVGKLRWRPPQSPQRWTGVRPAIQPGNECVQQAIFWRPGSPASWNEDCLYLNVYAPAAEAGTKRPVLVWFHGGGWVNGAGTDVQPTWLAAAGDVVVTVNYRLGALGYLALPALDAELADKQS